MNKKLVKTTIKILETPLIKFALIYLVLLQFFLFFGSRIGWEGDDVSQLEGIVNFQYKGATKVYSYHWQPLAYHLNIFVNDLVGNSRFLYLMPQIFGAANIVFLMAAIHLFSEKRISLLLIFSFLLLLPELFFCGLYYNSTVFAMLPMAIALFFLYWKQSSPFWDDIRYILVGLFSTLAVFFRFEFLLCLPLIWYLVIVDTPSTNRKIIIVLLSSTLVIAIGLITGIFDLVTIISDTMSYNADSQRLTLIESLKNNTFIAIISIHVIVWVALFIYFIHFLILSIKSKNWKSLLVFIPVVILLYPFTKVIFSPKYLIPSIIFVPFLLAKMATKLQEQLGRIKFKRLSYGIIVISFLLQILSLEPTKTFPYMRIESQPHYIDTVDGKRPFGAYLFGYNRVKTNHFYDGGGIDFANKLANFIASSDRNVDIIYLNKADNFTISSWMWAWPSFYLQLKGYKVQKYSPQNEIILSLGKQIVKMKILEEKDFLNYKNEGYVLIRVPYIRNEEWKVNKAGLYSLLKFENLKE